MSAVCGQVVKPTKIGQERSQSYKDRRNKGPSCHPYLLSTNLNWLLSSTSCLPVATSTIPAKKLIQEGQCACVMGRYFNADRMSAYAGPAFSLR